MKTERPGGSAQSDSITAYAAIEGRAHWMRVVLAGHEPIDLPLTVWTERSLTVGQVLSPAEIATLEELSRVAEAKEAALRYLNYRPRTGAEVVRHLFRKGVSEDVAKQVVADLTVAGLMSDEHYAANYHEAKQNTWSRAQIAHGLRQRGVRDEVTQGVVETTGARDAELVTAKRVAAKYWRTHTSMPQEIRTLKLAVHLQRRGFPMSVIHSVLDDVASHHTGEQDI